MVRETIQKYHIILDHASDMDPSYLVQSVESTSKLFFHSVLHQSNNVVRGLQGEGTVKLEEISSSLDDSQYSSTRTYPYHRKFHDE